MTVIQVPTTKAIGQNEQSLALTQAALDALPEPIFRLDGQVAALTPLNAAAERWSREFPHSADGTIPCASCFPELDLAALPSAAPRTWFTHGVNSATNQPCEVELQLHPLADDGEQQIVVVRPIGALPGDELPARGALSGAFHDPLTGLPNRRLFARRLERAIQRAGRGDYCFAVLFVDLDNFKSLNDRFGHLHGDEVLIGAGRRLLEAVRPQDMVARRDGDEFTILLDDLSRCEDAVKAAQRIVDLLQMPLTLSSASSDHAAPVTLRASIGIACTGGDALTADEMLARADAAMYHAKALGGGTYMTLDQSTDQRGAAMRRKPLPR